MCRTPVLLSGAGSGGISLGLAVLFLGSQVVSGALLGDLGVSVLLYNVPICVWVLREETLFSGTSGEEN